MWPWQPRIMESLPHKGYIAAIGQDGFRLANHVVYSRPIWEVNTFANWIMGQVVPRRVCVCVFLLENISAVYLRSIK